MEVGAKHVFKQSDVLDEQDFLPAPEAYTLLEATASSVFVFKKTKWRVAISAENIGNTVYRDYLNRLRYFADDLGINFRFRVGFEF